MTRKQQDGCLRILSAVKESGRMQLMPDRIAGVEFILADRQSDRREVLLQLFDGGRSADDRGDAIFVQHPGESELRERVLPCSTAIFFSNSTALKSRWFQYAWL